TCGLLRRYGCAEPSVSLALLGLLQKCTAVLADDPVRWAAVAEQTDLIRADATRETAQPADLTPVVTAAAELQRRVARHTSRAVRGMPTGSSAPVTSSAVEPDLGEADGCRTFAGDPADSRHLE